MSALQILLSWHWRVVKALGPSFHRENADTRDSGFPAGQLGDLRAPTSYVPVLRTSSALHVTLSVCRHITTTPSKSSRFTKEKRSRREGKGGEERGVVRLGEGWHGSVGEEEGEMKKRKERERNYRRGMKEK